ncbi:MAG: DUF4474 domain-containing protein [Bacilli bacterium]|nr:DUF4474 domain-containing protein [Bacilli bacterium]
MFNFNSSTISAISLILFITSFFLTLLLVSLMIYYLFKKLFLLAHPSTKLLPLDLDVFNKDLETFGFAYDLNQDIFFSTPNPWQRKYGYHQAYDDTAPLISLIIDCEPIYFKYNNRRWLIEFWKGQYGMTTGGEIGIYVSDDKYRSDSDVLYQSISDRELIPMSFILKKKKELLIKRNDRHWWLTGFKLGEFSNPSDLVMNITLTFPNQDMLDAFINGLTKIGYTNKHFKVQNQTIWIIYDKPFNKQSKNRNKITTLMAQKYNKNNCQQYHKITQKQKTTLEKINYLRHKVPFLYSFIMNSNKSEAFFKEYRPLSNTYGEGKVK